MGGSVRNLYRFLLQSFVAGVSAVCFVLTLIRRDWIEAVLGVDPDAGSGALEWLLTGGFLVIALTCGLLARRQWRRLAAIG